MAYTNRLQIEFSSEDNNPDKGSASRAQVVEGRTPREVLRLACRALTGRLGEHDNQTRGELGKME